MSVPGNVNVGPLEEINRSASHLLLVFTSPPSLMDELLVAVGRRVITGQDWSPVSNLLSKRQMCLVTSRSKGKQWVKYDVTALAVWSGQRAHWMDSRGVSLYTRPVCSFHQYFYSGLLMYIQYYTDTPAWANTYKSKAKPVTDSCSQFALFPIDINPLL